MTVLGFSLYSWPCALVVLALSVSVYVMQFFLKRRTILELERQREKSTDGLGSVVSFDAIRKIFRIGGSYFFSVTDGRIRITNADHAEALALESGLDKDSVRELLTITDPGVHSLELRLAPDAVTKHWYEMRMQVIRDGDHVTRHGILVPIDSIKQKESDLIEMHRRTINAQERDDFVNEMNHIIRTPLNAVVGFSQILSTPGFEYSREDVEGYRQLIEENTARLLKIIEGVLTISHIGSGSILLDNRQTSVEELMDYAVAENAKALSAAGISVSRLPGYGASTILADSRIMKQVLQTLIDNVINHAASGKLLAYGWQETEDAVELFIKDNGPGIGADDMPFIFKPFYKADAFSNGAGQGLAIAQGYLQSENAEIRCESTKGQGASFFIKFMKKAAVAIAAMVMLESCGGQAGAAGGVIGPWIAYALSAAVLCAMHIGIRRFRKIRLKAEMERMDQIEIVHTLRSIGGHLFKIADGKVLISKDTAKFFSLSTDRIDTRNLDSMDESNQEAFAEVMALEEGKTTEVIMSIPNFTTFKIMSFSAVATKMDDGDGKPVPMGIFYSMDETQQRLEKMREAFIKEEESKTKQTFLTSFSHEIRTPLNTIAGFSRLLSECYFLIDSKERQNYADIIRKSNDQLLELLDSALLPAREQEKLMKKNLRVVEVSGFMDEMFKIHHVVIPDYLTYSFEGQGEAYVRINRTSLRQIISNLINNACKFTEKGSITLGWKADEENVSIYVRDTGIGISEENLDNVFRQSYKADSTTSGAGLGLSLSKRLVEVMDGTLSVESKLGKGSCFTITLPRRSREEM